jgi:voltage-gated potassium channel Kch
MFNDVRWLEFVLDFVFIVDMFFNFFTAYTTDIKIVTNRKKIALHYLTTFFIVDLIGSVPGFLTGESFKELYILKIARFVNLQRFLVHSNYLLSRFKIFLAVVGIKLVIFLILLVHIFGWAWIYLGYSSNKGWIKSSSEYNSKSDWYLYSYPSAVYFITTTITTVGYGDFLPSSTAEILLVMLMELIGLAMFSWIIGEFSQLRGKETAPKIIKRKKEEIQTFLEGLNTAIPQAELPIEIFKKAHEYLDVNYKYGIKILLGEFDFLNEIKPNLKFELARHLWTKYYIKYWDFFFNGELGFQAHDMFIIQWLISFEPFVFMPGNSLVQKGEEIEYLYFIETGRVYVSIVNKNITEFDASDTSWIIAILPTHSFFGDYQILLDTASNVWFNADPEQIVVWYGIHKSTFLDLCHRYPGHYSFLLGRAIATRRLFQRHGFTLFLDCR